MADTLDIPIVRETIQSHADVPAADSSLYLHRAETVTGKGVRQSIVAGVKLVFKAGHPNNLHDAFHVSRDKKLDAGSLPTGKRALLIACDTLEIAGPLSLPEYDVAIYARRLIFTDHGNINTTPLDWDKDTAAAANNTARTPGQPGAHGRTAGSFAVFVDSVTAPEHESMARFVGRGGHGQHPGPGRNGDDGKSLSGIDNVFKHQDTGALNVFNASFSDTCVWAKAEWYWLAIVIHRENRGVDDWPTSGQDALAPGKPGSAGDGGGWISNQAALAAAADNRAGNPGRTESRARGGGYGAPKVSTHYDLTIRYTLFPPPDGDSRKTGTKTTEDGKSFDAPGPDKAVGVTPEKKTIAVANAWVHPLQLESMLRYARDAFLGEARTVVTELLEPYERALAAPLPAGDGLPWQEGSAARWTAAQADVASMLHRLRNGLDYFGNPAGYMPLLSLQATMRLYDLETSDALRTIMLATWVQQKADTEESAANALGAAIEDTTKDSARVAEELVQAEAKMGALDQQMTSLEQRLRQLSTDLERLRTKLFNQAANDEIRKGAIMFGVKMAAAICQVVPVGQPVLGTVGKLIDISSDISEKGTPDTLSKVGDTIKKAREAAEKAKKAKEEAKKKDKAADAPAAKKKAAAWETAGKGLGTAISMTGKAIGALQVSEEEIEVELDKLIASSAAWHETADRIRALNKDKAALFKQLGAVLQAIGDGYARLASNADAVATMHEQRNEKLGKLSVEAIQAIAKMGQIARLSLQRTLYLLVKAYETTVLKPIEVDWKLDLVFDKIATLMKPQKGFDVAAVSQFITVVAPLFDANKKAIKDRLIADYDFANARTSSLEFGFTLGQTPALLDRLHGGQSLVLNPVVSGLILPTRERAKAAGFSCSTLAFAGDGPAAPTSGNAIVSLSTAGDGTVRRGEHLYAVRGDAPRVWTWTYHFSSGTLTPSVPSVSSLDLLNLILESDNTEIKEKLAAPPAWSPLTISLDFTPSLAPEDRPRLEMLLFTCDVESLPSPAAQRVLDIRPELSSERLTIAPPDLAGRADGFGESYRIYSKAASVALTAPSQIGGRAFTHWELLTRDAHTRVDHRDTEITLDSDAVAFCRYAPAASVSTALFERYGAMSRAQVLADVGSEETAAVLMRALSDAPTELLHRGRHAGPMIIRSGPGADAPVIGMVGEGDVPTYLDGRPESAPWSRIAYGTLIGYVERQAAAAGV